MTAVHSARVSPSPVRRLACALGWVAPSAVAACAGALVCGVIDGNRGEPFGGWRLVMVSGLVAMLAVPVLLFASLAVRGLLRAWAPRSLVETWREKRGAMPRLAAWVGVVWLAALALSWAMFQGTWLLASWTAFKPTSIGFLEPMLAVLAVLVVVALSRPSVELLTWVARKIDRLWQRFAPGTLLRPWMIFGGAAITLGGVGWLIWEFLVTRRIPDSSLGAGFLIGPLAGLVTTVVAHFAWRGPVVVRGSAGALVGVATVVTIVAGIGVRSRPEDALAIWEDKPIGRLAIEQLFDLEGIRGELSLDAWKPTARTDRHPDIVLVTFDGVRADRTPVDGGGAAMPALDDLGERGAVFRSAYTAAPVTRRAIPSLITGVSPHRVHGALSGYALRLDPRHVTLAERLRAAGYETAAFTCCEEYWGEAARTGWSRGLDQVVIDDDLKRLGYAAREWVAKRERTAGNRPLFLWVHLTPAWARDRGATTDERIARYDQALSSVDGVLADLMSAFGTRSATTTPIFVVTSDRGEELGEHGQPFRADDLYNTQIHVPLIIAGPGVQPQSVLETVSLVDLLPTIIDLAGFQPPHGATVDGRSLVDITSGRRHADSPISMTGIAFAAIVPEQTEDGLHHDRSWAVVRGIWKLIDSGASVELYNLQTDPGERTNLAGQRMQQVSELRMIMNQRIKAGAISPF